MVKDRALWRYLESLAQDALAVWVAAAGTVEVGEIYIRRDEEWLQTNCCLDLVFGTRRIAAIAVESSEIDARLGPVGVVALGLDILARRTFKCGALLRRSIVRPVQAREGSRLRCAPPSPDRRGAARANDTRAFSGALASDCSAPSRTTEFGSRKPSARASSGGPVSWNVNSGDCRGAGNGRLRGIRGDRAQLRLRIQRARH